MPRKARHSKAGAVYHLISRFVDRDWFIKDEEDRSYYLQLFGRALADTDWRSLGYAVMSNHFHHAMVGGGERLDDWLRRVHSPFADWLNRKYGRIGCVFVRGPKQLEVEKHQVGRLIAYIHNNPVRAGIVAEASTSTWTSHRAYVGRERRPRWLHVDEGLALGGFRDRAAFDAFVRLQPTDPARDRLREKRLLEEPDERESFHRAVVKSVIEPGEIVEATARLLGIAADVMCSRRRLRAHVFARHVAVVSGDQAGLSGAAIARALGLSQQGASAILNRSKDVAVLEAARGVVASLEAKRETGTG